MLRGFVIVVLLMLFFAYGWLLLTDSRSGEQRYRHYKGDQQRGDR